MTRKLITTALSTGLALGISASPAFATPAGPTPSLAAAQSAVDAKIAKVLASHPRAKRLTATAVEVRPGMVREFSLEEQGAPTGTDRRPTCDAGWLCMWQEPNYRGDATRFYDCGTYDLKSHEIGRDRMSSVISNQVHATALFYDYNGAGELKLVFRLGSPGRLQDMRADRGLDGRPMDNRVDKVKPC